MIYSKNETHDCRAKSWVDSANVAGTDFAIQNLPLGTFRQAHSPNSHIGVAIGDQVFDLFEGCNAGLLGGFDEATQEVVQDTTLNAFMGLGPKRWSDLRLRLFRLLREDASSQDKELASRCLVPMTAAAMGLPASIGDYTDFYASIYHATNVGSMFRPDNPLLPNYKWVPIGYHGRSSSIVVSGTEIKRPLGQTKADGAASPSFGPSKRLDYELEVGVFVGEGNAIASPISLHVAEEHLFGLCLVNDWSARDLQTWEYQPLGPFLAKNFATSISPWVVTTEALLPYRTAAFRREQGDPAPLPYLAGDDDQRNGGFDITLEVLLRTRIMREQGGEPHRLSRGSFRDMYWTMAQLLTHHASNGCNLRPGDLIASGTVSGNSKQSRGSLLELSWKGTEPIELPTGERRTFLEDGDEVIIRGWCEREGFARIGFGECRGTIQD